jgi:nitrogen fixation protein FixH
LEFSADFKQAKIYFPATVLQGRIVFYRPSNAALDKSLEINSDTSGTAYIQTDFLQKGPWNVSLTWEKDGKKYIEEQRLIIP